MKPAPAPHIPGDTDAERFDNAIRKIFSVSKDDLKKAEEEWKLAQVKKRRAKKRGGA